MPEDGKGGWTDQGPRADLRTLAKGKHHFQGVPFVLADTRKDRKCCIVLSSDARPFPDNLPAEVTIPIGQVLEGLYFLHGFAYTAEGDPNTGIVVQGNLIGTDVTGTKALGNVIGIGIDFTACTMLPVKADGTPLCSLPEFADKPHAWVKLWKHHAAQPEADKINETARAMGEPWLDRYGGKISSEWFFSKALQILEDAPEVYAAADRLIEAADWAVWQLTGVEIEAAIRGIAVADLGVSHARLLRAPARFIEQLQDHQILARRAWKVGRYGLIAAIGGGSGEPFRDLKRGCLSFPYRRTQTVVCVGCRTYPQRKLRTPDTR